MPVLDQDSSLGVKYSSALRRIGLFNARPAPVNMPLWQRANGQNPDRATSTSAGTVTVILDSERRIRFFAQATSSIFNFIGADIGRPIFEMLSLTGDDKLITETMAALDGPVPHRCEITGMDGRVYDFSITAGEVPGTDETGFILSYTDVSGILAVGDRFEEAMSYAESIIEAIPQLFVILDRSLMIVSASKSFYDCFHLTEDEVIGEKITDIDGGRLDVISLRDFYDGLRGREANLGAENVAIARREGGTYSLTFNATALRGTDGQDGQILLTIRESASLSDLLAAKRRGDSAELRERRFLLAADHDLRQPLQTLFLVQGMLREKYGLDADGVNLVDQLEHATEEVSYMLNTLLTINQLEAGIIRPDPSEFFIANIFERLQAEFLRYAGAKGIDLRVVPSAARVRTDKFLFWQVIRNLLWNTVLRPERPTRLLLGCRRGLDGGLRIQLWARGGHGSTFSSVSSADAPGIPAREGEWPQYSSMPGAEVVAYLSRMLEIPFDIRQRQNGLVVCSFDFPVDGTVASEDPADDGLGAVVSPVAEWRQTPAEVPDFSRRVAPVSVKEPTADGVRAGTESSSGRSEDLSTIERSVAQEGERNTAARQLARLTPRQHTIATLVAEGHANKEIAYRLGISQRTVENHRSEMMSRLGVKSIAELVRLVVLAGG